MSDPPVFVGIDVSKAQLDVTLRPTDDCWHVNTDAWGITGLVERLRPVQPTLVVLQATGGLEVLVTGALAEAGLPVVVVHPRHAREFAQATGRLAKTDTFDARGLAHVAAAIHSSPLWRAKDEMLQSRPGVGPILARTLVAEVPELEVLNRQEIAALIGVAPFNREGGTLRGKRAVWGGRAHVCAVL